MAYLWVYTMALGARADGGFPALTGWIERVARSRCCRACWLLIVPSLAVCGLSPDVAAELSLDACAVRRLVQSRAVCHRVPARLPARACADAFWDAIERQRWIALSLAAVVLRWRFLALRWTARDGGMPLQLYGGSPTASINGFAWSPCSALPGAGSTGTRRAPLSHRCDLSLLHRAPDRDHHDRACAARQRPSGLAWKPAS